METVILLIDYGSKGAMGLVINRPTPVKLAKVLPGMKGLQKRKDPVYVGGPVARDKMLLLIRSGSQPEASHQVLKNVFVSPSRKVLERMIDDVESETRFRAYVGYAGWAPGQLDREVLRGDWHVMQADARTVFDKEPSEIWPELIRRSSAQWVRVQGADRWLISYGKRPGP